MPVLGYGLGNVSFVGGKNLEVLALLIVGISVPPLVLELVRSRRNEQVAG